MLGMPDSKEEKMRRMGAIIIALSLCTFASCQKDQGEVETLADFDALWDYDHPDSTEAKFRELLPAARKSGDADYRAQLLTQIARTQGLQMKFDDAHKTLDRVESMLTDELAVARIRYLLERGRVYNSSNEADSARPHFLEAWKAALANQQDYYAIDAAHMMAIIEPPEEQLVWSEKAMDQAERSSDDRAKRWLGSLYNNTGWTYHDMGQYEKALEMFQKSLAWNEKQGHEEYARIAKWTIARTYRSMERLEEALEMQRGLEREIEEKDLETGGYVYEEIAECLLTLGREAESKKYFKLAYDHLSKDQWLQANQPDRLKRLQELSS
jgi:tetratricopeptide (TPR) repeat protein